jgi:hypothetical protein
VKGSEPTTVAFAKLSFAGGLGPGVGVGAVEETLIVPSWSTQLMLSPTTSAHV